MPGVLTRPPELDDENVVDVLADGWRLPVDGASYIAAGFGSHHWLATAGSRRWFVTIDDLDTRLTARDDTRAAAAHRLEAALRSAFDLRGAGLDFVVAPEPTVDGAVLHRPTVATGRFAVALYPWVDGLTHEWGAFETREERAAVIDRLVDLHSVDAKTVGTCLVDDFTIPWRDELEAALVSRAPDPGSGPFAASAARLVADNGAALRQRLAAYDGLVARVRQRSALLVVTHGEPHRGNTITTSSGVQLIDWDTALLAPPERDLATAIGGEAGLADEYTARTGWALDADALALYASRWALCEISLFTRQLSVPHLETQDNRVAWQELQRSLGVPQDDGSR